MHQKLLNPYAMKNLLFALIALTVLSCSSEEKKSLENTQEDQLEALESEMEKMDSKEETVYTGKALGDGYFGEIYIALEDESIKSLDEIPAFEVLHAIPSYSSDDGIVRFMSTIVESGFYLSDPLDEFSGKVVLFYDKEKHHKAATFEVIQGEVDGIATVFTPKGRVLLEREYDQGKWTKSMKAPACADWNYDQSSSSLSINDLQNGKTTEEGSAVISLVPSLQKNADTQEILDKSSYVRAFKVNNQNYTGKLLAYSWTTHRDDFQTFELNFEDGLLHGDIKVYSEFFGLTLHEVFDAGDLAETVYVMNPEEMDGMAKPIIYFYPEETTELVVKLNLDGKLTHTYPKYKDQWNVTAHPDGTLFDENGQEYYALYWEGENNHPFTLNEGKVVPGENTVAFLEESLETLGLNRREANEFIMYWLPKMENNAYNLIHFSTSEYEEMAELDIAPKPETLIRVMMVFQPLDAPMTILEQDLLPLSKTRKGFTVVEWGGKEIKRTTLF